jgi:hypothetical protein
VNEFREVDSVGNVVAKETMNPTNHTGVGFIVGELGLCRRFWRAEPV